MARSGITDSFPGRIFSSEFTFGVRKKERKSFQGRKARLQSFDGSLCQHPKRSPARRIGALHRKPEQVEKLLHLRAPPRRESVDRCGSVLGYAFEPRVAWRKASTTLRSVPRRRDSILLYRGRDGRKQGMNLDEVLQHAGSLRAYRAASSAVGDYPSSVRINARVRQSKRIAKMRITKVSAIAAQAAIPA